MQASLSKCLAVVSGALTFLLAGLAVSAASPNIPFETLKHEVENLLRTGQSRAALEQLLLTQPAQENNLAFDYLLGTTALVAEEPEIAINALERVVLMQPNFAGAWLDLAIAYYRAGDAESAKNLIRHVDEHFDPPAKLKAELAATRKKIEQVSLVDGWRVNAGALAGYVKNANYGLSQPSFQLTPSGSAPIEVTVTGDSKPKSDQAFEARAEAYRKFEHGNRARSEVQLLVRAREYTSVKDQNFIDLSSYWAYSKTIAESAHWESQSGLTLRHLMLNGSSFSSYASAFTGLKTKVAQCDMLARLELEYRALYGVGQFNANIPWLGFGVSCPVGHWTFEGYYRHGWDNPEGNRPGGMTHRQEVSLQARWQPSETLQLRGVVYYADYQDASGYSALLNNGARRSIYRSGERVELAWLLPLKNNNRWLMQLELDNLRNNSNIATSNFKDTQLFMGLRYQLF